MENASKVSQLLSACAGKSPLLILTHNHPDPDSLASAWALQHLLEARAGITSKIAYGGIMGREENRSLNRLLKIRAVRLRTSHFKKFPYAALVDCQPGRGNTSLPIDKSPLFVIDHHPRLRTTQAPYVDIQPDCGATATILTEYLRSAAVEITPSLATALYYALISETQHLGREATKRDIEASVLLFPLVKHRLISRVEHPSLDREFFQQLHYTLEQAFTYKSFVGVKLGEIQHPDLVAQFADLLISLKRTMWCFVSGRYRGTLHFSLRTKRMKAKAGELLSELIENKGSAGGHDMIAGGQILLKGMSPEEQLLLEENLFKKLLKEIGYPEEIKPTPLVNLSSIIGRG